MIRDRIVVGIRDAALSERLQMDENLNLHKAVHTLRQSQVVKQQQATVRGESDPDDGSIGAIKTPERDKLKPWKSINAGPSKPLYKQRHLLN